MIRLAMALVMPLAAQAQTFALPAGCTGFLTVQRANCTVVNYYTCDSDPADWRRLVLMFPDGLDTFMIGDREGTWIETANNFSGVTDRFESAVDPMSMSTLLATGLDTYDFLILSDQEGISRITGTDRLTQMVRQGGAL
jgi:hypothetical protein